jgi:hypothetical protein
MTLHDLRCPQCSAHVTPGAEWCTLCFTDLRPRSEPPVPAPVPVAVAVAVAGAGAGAAVEPDLVADHAAEPSEGGRGKHARSASPTGTATGTAATATSDLAPLTAADRAALEARADEMLVMLAAQSSLPMGSLASRLESTGSRVVAGIIGLVVLSTAGLLVMTVLGHFI